MKNFLEWIKRLLQIAFWGGLTTVAQQKVEELKPSDTRKEPEETSEKGSEAVPEDKGIDRPFPVAQDTVKPGPTTFDKPVDESYGKNRKH